MESLEHPHGAIKPRWPGNVCPQTADDPPDHQSDGRRPFTKLYHDLVDRVSGAGITHYARIKALTRGRGLLAVTARGLADLLGLSEGHVRRLNKELAEAGLIRCGYRRLLVLDEVEQGRLCGPGDCEDPRANRAQTARKPRAEPASNPRAKRADLTANPRAKRADLGPSSERQIRKDGENVNVVPPGPDPDRIGRAETLLKRIRGRGWTLDSEKKPGMLSIVTLPGIANPGEEPTAEEKAELAKLRAEVLVVLNRRVGGKASPIDPEAQAEIRARIAALKGAGDGPWCDELAEMLVRFLGPEKEPELSHQTYRDLAREAAGVGGPVTAWLLSEAFEDACKPSVRVRGAYFIEAVGRRVRSKLDRSA